VHKIALITATLALALASQVSMAAATQDDSQPAAQPFAHRDARYRLCASDVIALTFPLTPEFNQTVSIQPDGFASLAGAGNVRLQGLTTAESEAAVRAAYAGILHEPIVTIDLKDFNKPYFIVGGEVGHPGKFDLRGETSATEAIAIAGGFNDSSRHSQVLLFRRVDASWYEVKPLNLKRILQGRNIAEDPEIQPGDMLYGTAANLFYRDISGGLFRLYARDIYAAARRSGFRGLAIKARRVRLRHVKRIFRAVFA
jgi:polysaccharide export outer membrane protein